MRTASAALSRRAALASCLTLGAAAAAPCASHAAADDADLLRQTEAALAAYAAFEALVGRWGETVRIPRDVLDEQERLLDVAHDLHSSAFALPARTAAGLRAKARLLLNTLDLSADGGLRPGQDDFEAWALCRDLIEIFDARPKCSI